MAEFGFDFEWANGNLGISTPFLSNKSNKLSSATTYVKLKLQISSELSQVLRSTDFNMLRIYCSTSKLLLKSPTVFEGQQCLKMIQNEFCT